jgi:hypothetical protein
MGRSAAARRPLQDALEEQREDTEGDVGADLGVGVMVNGPQLDDVLDESEVPLDNVLGAIEFGQFGGRQRDFGMSHE